MSKRINSPINNKVTQNIIELIGINCDVSINIKPAPPIYVAKIPEVI